jgi:hypothetical protein
MKLSSYFPFLCNKQENSQCRCQIACLFFYHTEFRLQELALLHFRLYILSKMIFRHHKVENCSLISAYNGSDALTICDIC